MLSQQVEHHPDRHCFTLPAGGQEAILQYRLLGSESDPKGVDFTRTFVPEASRGKGIAEALVRRGLAWAREEDYEIRATCWYVEKFLRQ